MVTCKPIEYNYICEYDNIDNFFFNDDNILIDYNKDSSKMYIEKRIEAISNLRNLISNYGYRDAVFFLSVSYLDYICLKNSIIDLNLVVCTCFILASKSFYLFR